MVVSSIVDSANNYGFGTSNIEENIEEMKNTLPKADEFVQKNRFGYYGNNPKLSPSLQNAINSTVSNLPTPLQFDNRFEPYQAVDNAVSTVANDATLRPIPAKLPPIPTPKPKNINKYQYLIDRHFDDMAGIEKSIRHVYLDSTYNKTIGRGHNINNYDIFDSVNYYVDDNGVMRIPTEAEKQKCFAHFEDYINKNKPLNSKQNYLASSFADYCNLRITPEEEKRLYLAHINRELPRISKIVPNYDQLSDNKKLLIMDMVYNLGHDGFKTKFPKFIEAAKLNKTDKMLEEYHRKNVGSDRNDWAKRLLEEDLKNNR